jgi:hypothetical protein
MDGAGREVNGAGSGFFEYHIPWPAGLDARGVNGATFLVEASAKRLNGKDRDSTMADNGDYMRGGGFHDRSRNPNSYPMTSATPFPSAVTIRVNGFLAGRYELTDDPADSRGILSWQAQPHDGHLHEAGSYGQLLRVALPAEAVAEAARAGEVVIRLEVDESLPGGLGDLRRAFRAVSAGPDRCVCAQVSHRILPRPVCVRSDSLTRPFDALHARTAESKQGAQDNYQQ